MQYPSNLLLGASNSSNAVTLANLPASNQPLLLLVGQQQVLSVNSTHTVLSDLSGKGSISLSTTSSGASLVNITSDVIHLQAPQIGLVGNLNFSAGSGALSSPLLPPPAAKAPLQAPVSAPTLPNPPRSGSQAPSQAPLSAPSLPHPTWPPAQAPFQVPVSAPIFTNPPPLLAPPPPPLLARFPPQPRGRTPSPAFANALLAADPVYVFYANGSASEFYTEVSHTKQADLCSCMQQLLAGLQHFALMHSESHR